MTDQPTVCEVCESTKVSLIGEAICPKIEWWECKACGAKWSVRDGKVKIEKP
jgi:ribosomal protein L37AE/L43A